MDDNSNLYELIFCTSYGLQNRQKLLEENKDKIEILKLEHDKHGLKINGRVIPFENCIK